MDPKPAPSGNTLPVARGNEDDSPELRQFRAIFWRAFASLAAKSHKYDQLRGDLELASDQLAGPMYSIFAHGGCDYVFGDQRFPGVKDPRSFLGWCLAAVKDFRRLIESVDASTEDERSDRERLLGTADEMKRLSELGERIVAARQPARRR